jgi:nitrate/nitrite transporter NarK
MLDSYERKTSAIAFFAWMLVAAVSVLAAAETDLSKNGIALSVAASPDRVDVARDFEVVVKAVAPAGTSITLPDLRDRFRGFSVAEDFSEEPLAGADGKTVYVSSWRLVPKPCDKVYKLLPFAVTLVRRSDGGEEVRDSLYTSPVYFQNPPARESVTGGIEVAPEKDMPPLSWRLVRCCALILVALCAAAALVWWAVKKVAQKKRMMLVQLQILTML